MRIAYLVNQYPMVSHSFIRREIIALEQQGFEITRIALQGWDEALADERDVGEQARTLYVLRNGPLALLWPLLLVMMTAPLRFVAALWLALRSARRSDRSAIYHLAYLAEACQVLRWLAASGVEHVHAHFATNSTDVVMLARALGGPPYSFTVHGTGEFDRLAYLGAEQKVRRAAFVIAASSYARSQVYRRIPHSEWSKVEVVHCGLERSFHAVGQAPIPDSPRLVCVGRISAEKGQLLLIEASHRLACKGIRVEIVLAGDGEMRRPAQELIARYGLDASVRITGWLSSDDVRKEILAARGLVVPSLSEGLPVVIMEAMALRRPVLSSCVGGIPELVKPGRNGWLFASGSVDALATAVEDFLARSTEELRRMGDAAHKCVTARHCIETEAGKLATLFRREA